MIIYSSDKGGFLRDLPNISDILKTNILTKLGEESSEGEIRSWKNSLSYMGNVLDTDDIPNDVGIALEYNIPVTNNRVDFIITGVDCKSKCQAVLIELKQWQHIQLTNKDGIVKTHYEDGMRETTHPSYQVASYASLLYDFKEAIQKRQVQLHPCAFLHNYVDDDVIRNAHYNHYVDKAPVFCKGEEDKLRSFIKTFIYKGDQDKSIYVIEDSMVVPSKSLIDCVVSMAEGNPEFKMIDEQKVVYQNILWAYEEYLRTGKKQVVIVKGGPGTGKSVIAIKLLVAMTKRKLLSHYITKNAAPRNVLYSKFMGIRGVHASIKNLFKSSGIYIDVATDSFDMLLADEAHRLQEHSGLYGNQGENQIKEIINAAKVSVFFIDEHQRISLQDIGSVAEIEKWADFHQANVLHYQLVSQFRCSGSDEYMNWLDHLLQYDNKKPIQLSGTTYDFQVIDSPSEMMALIRKHNRRRNKSRLVAGYCWKWISKKGGKEADIVFPEDGFAYQWNLSNDKTWSISKGSVDQIGCIHTCQGLEFDYVGVIIGEDIICRDGQILVNPGKRSSDDYSIRGWKTNMAARPEETKAELRDIIKNTYRTLMTRGMKGCYVYVCDEELREYIKLWS